MEPDFIEMLERRTLLMDGAMGTALQALGLPVGQPPESWLRERPQEVIDVHLGYLGAGSRCIQTNTFGANRPRLEASGLQEDPVALNELAACLAREAVERSEEEEGLGVWIAGSVGPTGSVSENADAGLLEEAFAEQATGLLAGGVDLFSVETMTRLDEALTALEVLREVADLPVLVSLTFEHKANGFFTPTGDSLKDCAQSLSTAGASMLGANCCAGSLELLEAAPQLLRASRVPVLIRPNAGLPRGPDGATGYCQRPAEFAQHLALAAGLGVSAVGGCCGTDASFIEALKSRLSTLETEAPTD